MRSFWENLESLVYKKEENRPGVDRNSSEELYKALIRPGSQKIIYIFHSNKYCKRKPMSAEVLSWGSILGSMKRIRKTREYEDFSKSS